MAPTRKSILSEDDPPVVKVAKGPRCTVTLILQELDEDSAAVLNRWLADSRYPHTAIADKLAEIGYPVGDDTVGRHRRGRCTCQR